MSLKERLIKNSTISGTADLRDSVVFQAKDFSPTRVPMVNVALSGTVVGGLAPGLGIVAGPSKHFKTGFALLTLSAFLDKNPGGIALFYDSEFGSPASYFDKLKVDTGRVVHTPITNIEELKFDIVNQLEKLEKNDKVFILVDSIGNLASKKELEDAKDQKAVADMSRSKALKSLFRIITPYLTLKAIPMVAINHTYKTMEMFSKDVMSGGTGPYYSADWIWFVGRQQEKDGDDLAGWNFIINIEKSRHVREKIKIPLTVTFEEGIDRYSGLFEIGQEIGIITSPKKGYFVAANPNTGEVPEKGVRRAELEDDVDYWESVLTSKTFIDYIEKNYKL